MLFLFRTSLRIRTSYCLCLWFSWDCLAAVGWLIFELDLWLLLKSSHWWVGTDITNDLRRWPILSLTICRRVVNNQLYNMKQYQKRTAAGCVLINVAWDVAVTLVLKSNINKSVQNPLVANWADLFSQSQRITHTSPSSELNLQVLSLHLAFIKYLSFPTHCGSIHRMVNTPQLTKVRPGLWCVLAANLFCPLNSNGCYVNINYHDAVQLSSRVGCLNAI